MHTIPRTTFRFLDSEMAAGPDGELGELREANPLLDDMSALRERFREDGYLLIRGMHPREEILAVRRQMIALMAEDGCFDRTKPLDEAWQAPGVDGAFHDRMGQAAGLRPQVESPHLMQFFDRFLGGKAMTFDFKWYRATAPGKATGAHLDMVYMGRGTPNLVTCWTPWGDVPREMGALAILVGSHCLPSWERVHATYGRMDVDRDHVEGWFSDDPRHLVETYGGRWATTDFRAGDVLLFGMRTIHASLTNATGRYRLTTDTRYQLATDPIDERWVAKAGKPPIGHYGWHNGQMVQMADKKREWGLT